MHRKDKPLGNFSPLAVLIVLMDHRFRQLGKTLKLLVTSIAFKGQIRLIGNESYAGIGSQRDVFHNVRAIYCDLFR